MLERNFQSRIKAKIKARFPDSFVMKTDPQQINGLPDLLILNGNKWAALECKRSSKAHKQTHQDYYVNKMNKMSYASFISPENEEEVFEELERVFKS